MFKAHNRLFEHFGKRDGLQDEHQYGLQYMSNHFKTGSRNDLNDMSLDTHSAYVSRSSLRGYEKFGSDYRDYESHGRSARQNDPGVFGSGSRRSSFGQDGGLRFDAGLYNDSDNVYNGGIKDIIEDFQVRGDYRRDRYSRDRDRGRTYRSRRGSNKDYIHDREYQRERRRGSGRISAEPFMLPQCNSYYPIGPYGPRVQFCPYVPLMMC